MRNSSIYCNLGNMPSNISNTFKSPHIFHLYLS
jgi:hypothetical protein